MECLTKALLEIFLSHSGITECPILGLNLLEDYMAQIIKNLVIILFINFQSFLCALSFGLT